MLPSVSIRSVTQADYNQWLPLWEGYNAFYGREGDTALSAEIILTTWQRFFDEQEPVYALVAEYDGRLCGIAHYLLHRSTISITPVCYMQDLFTDETVRGRGIGRALIDAVYADAKLEGCSRLYWHTHETNDTAMLLYDKVAERSGFIVYRKMIK